MKPIAALLIVAAALAATLPLRVRADSVAFGSGANQFSMEFVTVGNPGNPGDATGPFVLGGDGPFGAVAYSYRIGKYEVTRDMVLKANASVVSGGGNLGITLQDMSSLGGNGADRPATGISWHEAARFVNWLNTSQGYSPAYKFTTQPGGAGYSANSVNSLWQTNDAGYNAANRFRNTRARYVLPSEHEWHKAAYYSPDGTYFDYPTGSSSPPTPVASGTAARTAVFRPYTEPIAQGPADVTAAGGLSPYGTMGQGGNVMEWEETEVDRNNNDPIWYRGIRGGSWNFTPDHLEASVRVDAFLPLEEFQFIGFRVAAVVTNNSDFNNDGVVNGADFLVWQRGLGLTGVAANDKSTGDANGDGSVNDADLALWTTHFSGAPAHVVPEPRAMWLAALSGSWLCQRRSFGRRRSAA